MMPKSFVHLLYGLFLLIALQAYTVAPGAAQTATLEVHNNTRATLSVHTRNIFSNKILSGVLDVPPESAKRLDVPMGKSQVVFIAGKTRRKLAHQREHNFYHSGVHEIEVFSEDFGVAAMFDSPDFDSSTAQVSVGGCADISGVWTQKIQGKDGGCQVSTWILSRSSGDYTAQETSCGHASAAVTYSGGKVTLDWTVSDTCKGTYIWNLNAACTGGTGRLTFDTDSKGGCIGGPFRTSVRRE